MNNFLAPVKTCSACAGDYEDPDWPAWTDEEDQDEDEPFVTRVNELLVPLKGTRQEGQGCEE